MTQCRDRLEESRRMCLASLDIWPAEPYMDNTVEVGYLEGPLNPAAQFCRGLSHAASHLDQFAEVVRQAKAAR